VQESCSGSSAACPSNAFQPSSTVCRTSAGQCDVAENCSGSGASCPSDGFVANGTSCNDGNSSTCGEVCTTGACGGGGSCSNAAPTTSITSPAGGTFFTAPASITINANASDSDGTISKVEFYNGATLMNGPGGDTSSPYSHSMTSVGVGSYSLTSKAYDNLGATGFGNRDLASFSNRNNTNTHVVGLDYAAGRWTHSGRFSYLNFNNFIQSGNAAAGTPLTLDPGGKDVLVRITGILQDVGPDLLAPQQTFQDNKQVKYDSSRSPPGRRWKFTFPFSM